MVSADQVIILRETASVTPPTEDLAAKPSENEGAVIPTDQETSQETDQETDRETSQETQQSESVETVKEQENDAEKQGFGNQEAESQNSIVRAIQ